MTRPALPPVPTVLLTQPECVTVAGVPEPKVADAVAVAPVSVCEVPTPTAVRSIASVHFI